MLYQQGNAVGPTFIDNIIDSMCQNHAILLTNPTIASLNVMRTYVEGSLPFLSPLIVHG